MRILSTPILSLPSTRTSCVGMYRAPSGFACGLIPTQSNVGGSSSQGAPSTMMLSTNQPASELGDGVPVLLVITKRILQLAKPFWVFVAS